MRRTRFGMSIEYVGTGGISAVDRAAVFDGVPCMHLVRCRYSKEEFLATGDDRVFHFFNRESLSRAFSRSPASVSGVALGSITVVYLGNYRETRLWESFWEAILKSKVDSISSPDLNTSTCSAHSNVKPRSGRRITQDVWHARARAGCRVCRRGSAGRSGGC